MVTNIIWSLLTAILVAILTRTIVIVSKFTIIYLYNVALDFICSVITVSGNRPHLLSRRRWWLCTLEAAAVVLDKFIIMGAHAARSCRTMTISALFARHGGKKVASEAPETPDGVRRRLVMFAALLAAVTCQAGLSTPDAFLSGIQADDEHLPGGGDPMLRGRHQERLVVPFLCFNSLAFVASLVVVMLLMTRTVTCHGHGLCSWALQVCTGVTLVGLTGALAIWSSTSLTTSICFSALVVAVLLCNGPHVLAFLRKPVENWDRNSQETLQKCSEHWDTAESEDHRDPAVSDPQETADADQLRQTSRVLAFLAASITYQAGVKPPGGLWQANATDGLHHYHAGDPILLHTTYPWIYGIFFYFNATGFVASLVILMLLLTKECRARGIKYSALQVAMTLDLLGLIGAYAAGNCSESADPAIHKDDPNRPINRNNPGEATWRVACAAPHHMTGNRSLLLTGGYLPVRDGNDGEVVMVHPATNREAVPLRVHGSGSVRTESIALDDVWYVPGLDSNLVSTGQLARQGCAVNLGPGGCRITRGGGALVGTARFTEACQFELDFLKVA